MNFGFKGFVGWGWREAARLRLGCHRRRRRGDLEIRFGFGRREGKIGIFFFLVSCHFWNSKALAGAAGGEGRGREEKRARGDWRVRERSVKAGEWSFEALCSVSDFGICAWRPRG